jgi:hypothetical protein
LNKKLFLPLIILAVVALLAGGGILWWSLKSSAPLAEPTPAPMITSTPTVEPTVGPIAPAEETKSDLDSIKEAFAEKYNKSFNEITLSIEQNTGTYAKGGVKFTGEIAGAWWLAYNDASGWIIVADGNGTVLCSDIEPYNFPVDMVPECWDEANSELITR